MALISSTKHAWQLEAFAEVFAQKMMANKAQIRSIVPEELIKIAQDKQELTSSLTHKFWPLY